jgi:hypothetical protein
MINFLRTLRNLYSKFVDIVITLKIVYFREPSKFLCFKNLGKNLLGPWKYLTRIMAIIYSAVATYVLREAKFLKQRNLLGSRK